MSFHETRKCPSDSIALLPGVGLCNVVSSAGFSRQVSYRVEPDDPSIEITCTVPVQQLRHLDPWKDLTGS